MKVKDKVKKSRVSADIALECLRCAEGGGRSGSAVSFDLSLREIADPPRSGSDGPAVAPPTKDAKNRGNELNKSFRMNKTSKKRTQNELQLRPKTTLRRVKFVPLGRLAQTLLVNVCDAPKAQAGQVVRLALTCPLGAS